MFCTEEIYCLICPKEGAKKNLCLPLQLLFHNHLKGRGAEANPISVGIVAREKGAATNISPLIISKHVEIDIVKKHISSTFG